MFAKCADEPRWLDERQRINRDRVKFSKHLGDLKTYLITIASMSQNETTTRPQENHEQKIDRRTRKFVNCNSDGEEWHGT